MVTFHCFFDLNHFGLLSPRQNFYEDPFWTWQRSVIVSIFLFCAGLSQAVALSSGQSRGRFWRRWGQIAGCAVLVSVGSWIMFPNSWISFGVLHGIAVMTLLVRLAAPCHGWLWWIGAGSLVLPLLFSHPVFDSRWTNGLGLVTRKPVTEDFVPILPWLGFMCWGLAAGQWIMERRPQWLRAELPVPLRLLAGPGRWSLTVYMLHQPVLMGLLMAWVTWRAR